LRSGNVPSRASTSPSRATADASRSYVADTPRASRSANPRYHRAVSISPCNPIRAGGAARGLHSAAPWGIARSGPGDAPCAFSPAVRGDPSAEELADPARADGPPALPDGEPQPDLGGQRRREADV